MKSNLARPNKLELFSALSLGIMAAGAFGSLDLTLKAAHGNKSFLLLALFIAWVESPFIVCVAANIASRAWSVLARGTLYVLMIFITGGSLVGYSGILSTVFAKPSAIFLLVPLLSWAIMVVIYLTINFRKTDKM